MKAYFYHARNAFKRVMSYRYNIFFRVSRSMLIVFPQVFLWRALYAGRGVVAGVDLAQMITYVVLSRFVGIAISVGGAGDIESKMKTGDIGIDLLRPASPRLLFVSENLGYAFAGLLLDGLPVLIASIAILGGIKPPASLGHFVYFLVATVGALMITVSLEILLGTFAFWFLNVWFLSWILHFFDLVLSGASVPLWFFPHWLRSIAEALPFQAARFIPIAIYLGRYSHEEILGALTTQALWIVGLIALQNLLWRKGIRRIIVLGG